MLLTLAKLVGSGIARRGRDALRCHRIYWPGVTLTALALPFAAYALLDGILSVLKGGPVRSLGMLILKDCSASAPPAAVAADVVAPQRVRGESTAIKIGPKNP